MEQTVLACVLSLSVILQMAAALVAVRLVFTTGKPLVWTPIAAALVCMTLRRMVLIYFLYTGAAAQVSLASEVLGLVIAMLMLAGMLLAGNLYQHLQRERVTSDLVSRRLQDSSAAGRVALWDWNIASGSREWTPLVDEMLGFQPNGLPRSYRAWEARIHPEDLAGVQEAIRRNFETNAPYDVTYHIQRADGTYALWHEVGHVHRDTHGSPVALAGASVDITERTQREEEYAAIVKTALEGICVASSSTGRLLDVNDAYCRLVGYTRAELLGMRITDLEEAESPGEARAHVQRLLRDGQKRYEARLRHKNGPVVDVGVSVHAFANNSRFCAFVSDITERKRNEAALRERMDEIERFNQLTIQREQRMMVLKQQINELAQDAGRQPPHLVHASNVVDAPEDPTGRMDAPVSVLPEPTLEAILDRRVVQTLLEGLSAAAGVAATLADLKGTSLLAVNLQPLCTAFHRIHERSWMRCMESDNLLAAGLAEGKGYALYECRNGLHMAAAPIIIENRTWGHLFLSQFFLQPPDVAFFRRQAVEFGYAETAYLAALDRVPVVPRDKLAPWLTLLTGCAGLVARSGQERLHDLRHAHAARSTAAALRLQREAALNLAEDSIEVRHLLEVSENALRQNRDMLARILDAVPQAIFWKDRQSVYLGCNQRFAQAMGLSSPEELIGKTDCDLLPSREESEAYAMDDREVMALKRTKRHIVESVQRADGQRTLVDATKLPVFDQQGQVCGVLGVYETLSK
ncbi:MAG: PAS domain S-box protein [bacterium]